MAELKIELLHWTRRQLYQWGVRNRAVGVGYPGMASTEKARIGRGGLFCEAKLPPDLEDVDNAVRLLAPPDKMVIAECYTHNGTHVDHMIRLRMPESTYFRRKKVAETAVYWSLQRESEYLHYALG